MFEDDELEWDNVVWVDPVFCGLTDKGALGSTCARVALDRVTTGAHEIKELGEFDDELVVVFLVKGTGGEVVLDEFLAEEAAGLLVVLLYDLVETGVVEFGKEGEIVDVCDDDCEALLELDEALLVSVGLVRVAVKLVVGSDVVGGMDDAVVVCTVSAAAMAALPWLAIVGFGFGVGRGS